MAKNRDGLKQVKGAFDSSNFGAANPGAMYDDYHKAGAAYGDPAVAAQRNQLARLERQAQGLGPSIAETQLRAQSARNMSDAMSMAAMGRGGNQAGMQMAGLGALSATQADTNNQAAMTRLAEQQQAQAMAQQQSQMMAQNQLAWEGMGQQGLITGRQQDMDWQLGKGALDLERQKYHTARNMGWAQVGADAFGSLLQGIGGVSGGGQQPSDERVKTGVASAATLTSEEQEAADKKKAWEDFGASVKKIGDGGGQYTKAVVGYLHQPTPGYRTSDERAKQGVRPMSASQAVGEIEPIGFEYKPGYGASGQQLGVSAQQLETTQLGESLVSTGPDGLKRVDVGGAAMAGLAGTADNSRRLDALERGLGQGGGQQAAGGQWDYQMGGRGQVSDERAKDGTYSASSDRQRDDDPFSESSGPRRAPDLGRYLERPDRVSESYLRDQETRGRGPFQGQQSFGMDPDPEMSTRGRSMEDRIDEKRYNRRYQGDWSLGRQHRGRDSMVEVDPFDSRSVSDEVARRRAYNEILASGRDTDEIERSRQAAYDEILSSGRQPQPRPSRGLGRARPDSRRRMSFEAEYVRPEPRRPLGGDGGADGAVAWRRGRNMPFDEVDLMGYEPTHRLDNDPARAAVSWHDQRETTPEQRRAIETFRDVDWWMRDAQGRPNLTELPPGMLRREQLDAIADRELEEAIDYQARFDALPEGMRREIERRERAEALATKERETIRRAVEAEDRRYQEYLNKKGRMI